MGHHLARCVSLLVRGVCIVVLAACGGGDGGGGAGGGGAGGGGAGGGGAGGGGTGGGGGGAAGPVVAMGTFIDALTAGVQYSASGAGAPTLSGTTGSNGQFSYYAGQTVTFTLAAGSGGSIALGSALPERPASGSAVVFVGGMNNALQVAQVLQSLNHAPSNGAIDVSALTLSMTDVANLNAFISSGGTSFGSGANYPLMMQSAQASAQAGMSGLTFVYPGGATPAQAAANLATAAGALTPPASIIGITGYGGLYFYQFVASTVGTSPTSYTQSGMTQFVHPGGAGQPNAGTFTSIAVPQRITPNFAYTPNIGMYRAAGHVLTETRTINNPSGTEVTTVTVTYQDSVKVLSLFNLSVADNGTLVGTGTGVAYALSEMTPAGLAGLTLTLPDVEKTKCSPGSFEMVFSADGTAYTGYCSGAPTTPIETGTVSAGPSGIGAVQVTKTPTPPATVGNTHLVALASGSIAAGSSGTVAILTTANDTNIGVDGLFSFTAK